MKESQSYEPRDPRVTELEFELLRIKLVHEASYATDIEGALAGIRHTNAITEEMIRHLAEKYYPGRLDMGQKEKAVRMLATAFLIRYDIDRSMQSFDVAAYLASLDKLDSEPPEPYAH